MSIQNASLRNTPNLIHSGRDSGNTDDAANSDSSNAASNRSRGSRRFASISDRFSRGSSGPSNPGALFASQALRTSSASAADFRSWRSHGPTQYNLRLASLNMGVSYSRLMREYQSGNLTNYNRAQQLASQMPRRSTINNGQWQDLIRREQAAMSGHRGPMTVLYGDSNTHAPFEIFSRASSGAPILNHAISGDTTTGILDRIQRMDPVNNPGKVILSGGTNDLRALYAHGRRPSSSEVNAKLNEIINNKKESVWALLGQRHYAGRGKNPNARVHLASVLPADHTIPQSVIRNLNRRIEQLSKDLGVPYVDVTTPMALGQNGASGRAGEVNPRYTTDGIHFTGEGYHRIGEAMGLY